MVSLGSKGKYVGPYRITDSDSLEAAMQAAGRIRLVIEAKLSPGPPILNLRRHGDHSRFHELGVGVSGGNFLAAKVSSFVTNRTEYTCKRKLNDDCYLDIFY